MRGSQCPTWAAKRPDRRSVSCVAPLRLDEVSGPPGSSRFGSPSTASGTKLRSVQGGAAQPPRLLPERQRQLMSVPELLQQVQSDLPFVMGEVVPDVSQLMSFSVAASSGTKREADSSSSVISMWQLSTTLSGGDDVLHEDGNRLCAWMASGTGMALLTALFARFPSVVSRMGRPRTARSPRLQHPAVLTLLERFGSPAQIRKDQDLLPGVLPCTSGRCCCAVGSRRRRVECVPRAGV